MHFESLRFFSFGRRGKKSFLFWVRGVMDVFFSILGHG